MSRRTERIEIENSPETMQIMDYEIDKMIREGSMLSSMVIGFVSSVKSSLCGLEDMLEETNLMNKEVGQYLSMVDTSITYLTHAALKSEKDLRKNLQKEAEKPEKDDDEDEDYKIVDSGDESGNLSGVILCIRGDDR